MAVVEVKEIREQATAGKSNTGRTAVKVFQVITDDAATGEFAVLNATGIPELNEGHSEDAQVKVNSVDTAPEEGRLKWLVTVNYATANSTDPDNPDDEDPTKLPPQISFGEIQYNKVIEKAYEDDDKVGQPSEVVQNSAEDPFDPPIMQEEADLLIMITQNVREFDPNYVLFRNAINSSPVTVAGVKIRKHQGRLRSIKPTKMWDQESEEYWQVQYEIEVKSKTQIRSILDQGLNYVEDDTKKAIPVEGTDGEEEGTANPQKLDGSGGILAVGGDPEWLEFQTYYARSWKPLNLPDEY